MKTKKLAIILAVILLLVGVVTIGAGMGLELNQSPYACQNAGGYSALCR